MYSMRKPIHMGEEVFDVTCIFCSFTEKVPFWDFVVEIFAHLANNMYVRKTISHNMS